jgi:Uma2 family endonuclease
MAIRRKRPASYADIEALPEHLTGELIDGELFVSPRPASPHANVQSVLGGELNMAFHRRTDGPRGPGGWFILDEPELHLDGDVLVPDLAGWRRTRVPSLPSTVGLAIVPDWVCEILSPSTTLVDIRKKTPIYAKRAVHHLWRIDPIARVLEVFRLEDGRYVLVATHGGDEESARIEPFAEIELELSRWWLEEEPAR